ncbi:hypothetical protein [Streptosporangium sp. NPDC049376]
MTGGDAVATCLLKRSRHRRDGPVPGGAAADEPLARMYKAWFRARR